MRRRLILIVLLFLPITVARAQTPPEFLVNTYTTGTQSGPAAAMDSSGNFVIVWISSEQGGVFGQKFDASGSPLGSEFQVNPYTISGGGPSVAMDPSGRFVVAWAGAQEGSDRDIFAQRFDVDGTPLGSELQVNTYTTGLQYGADVALDDLGNFVVVWQSGASTDADARIRGRRFDASGSPLGSEFQANDSTLIGSIRPAVAMNGAGEFVVSWNDADYNGYALHLRYRPYDSSGAPLCSYGVVSVRSVRGHDLVMVPSGDFLATWSEFGDHSYDVWIRRYHGCSSVGSGMRVNTYTDEFQGWPTVAADAAGNSIVAWHSPQDGSAYGTFAQRFDGNDNPVGAEYQVNIFTPSYQRFPAAAMNGNGSFVLTWESQDQDGSGWGVYARLGEPSQAGLSVDDHPAGAPSNLNGLLEEGETVRVEPAWRNELPADLDLTGTASSLTGPSGPTYEITDASADYGTVPVGEERDCAEATGNCYEVSIVGARPALHWDAELEETTSTGDVATWTIHVGDSFFDVPTTHMFYADVENVLHHGVTQGCGAGNYCPSASVRRDQMAVFLLKAVHGGAYVPPPCAGLFIDVPCPGPFADWIERLFVEGISGGCGGGNYCPSNPVSRAQMAVFLLKAKHGSGYAPPVCNGVFQDVPCPSLFADWIERLYHEGITAGCGGANYCPDGSSTRGQMAVFLVKTFGFQLYGPWRPFGPSTAKDWHSPNLDHREPSETKCDDAF